MFYIKKYYRKCLLVITILIIIILLFNLKNIFNKKIEPDNSDIIKENSEFFEIKESVKENKKSLKFNIKGAVANPGVYEFSEGERVIDAINKSGGLLENSDTSVINLSKNLIDEMVIVIYTKDEVNEMKGSNVIIQYVEKECNCPKLLNDACITNNEKKEENNVENKKISLNNATLEELQTLTGIGKSKAEAIIKYREDNNGFKEINEIMNISGIGESLFEKIKDNISL